MMNLGIKYNLILIPSVGVGVIRTNVELVAITNKTRIASQFMDVYTRHMRIKQQVPSLSEIDKLTFYVFLNNNEELELRANEWIESYVEL